MSLAPIASIRQDLQQKIFGHHTIDRYNPYSRAIFHRLSQCHTIGIGMHEYRCDKSSCDHKHYQYHSCGNRHCPNCGGMKREDWIEDRTRELLPTHYYHIVFTIPAELRSIVMGNRKEMYHLLFESAHHAIHEVTKDPKWLGAKPGIISILHTWGQDLTFHPHIHCIVSGGGLDKDGKWVRALRDNGKFFVPQTLLEKAYKTYMTTQINKQIASKTLQLLDEKSVNTLLDEVKKKRWNIYAKAPFAGPSEIVEYLGRYTHKVAITPHRILNITNTEITFKYKDYADNHQQKEMTLSNEEFVRRYEQHILPKNFVRIRHAGYLCHRGKKERIVSILTQLNLPKPAEKVLLPIEIKVLIRTGTDISICPKCKEGKLVRIATYLQHNGSLVNINDLRNRGSPKRLIIVIPNA